MAVPKGKHSLARKRKRRSHLALPTAGLPKSEKARSEGSRSKRFFCSNCNQPKAPHSVCANCGYYRGRPVIEVER